MHLNIAAAIVGIMTVHALAADAPHAAPSSQPTRSGWTLTWHDEFDGPKVDPAKWEVVSQRDSHNNEKQYYVPEQATMTPDGMLRITATNEPLEGKLYRSARLHSIFTQRYGRFECRAKLPSTQGMWPAFWLLPRPANWPKRGEIDVMESKGSKTTAFGNAYHFADPKTGKHRYVTKSHDPKDAKGNAINLADDFHVYGVEWEPGELRFYLDDNPQPLYRVTNDDAPISDQPMGVILNLAVGGWYGGDPDSSTVFPQHFDIDFVRVWKRNEAAGAK
jgi:beta-glucanase (GH16 family)